MVVYTHCFPRRSTWRALEMNLWLSGYLIGIPNQKGINSYQKGTPNSVATGILIWDSGLIVQLCWEEPRLNLFLRKKSLDVAALQEVQQEEQCLYYGSTTMVYLEYLSWKVSTHSGAALHNCFAARTYRGHRSHLEILALRFPHHVEGVLESPDDLSDWNRRTDHQIYHQSRASVWLGLVFFPCQGPAVWFKISLWFEMLRKLGRFPLIPETPYNVPSS